MLSEYLAARYPGARWLLNAKLGGDLPPRTGMDLTESERRMLQVYKRYADAVVITTTEIVVIEATILNSLHKVGPLLQYVALVPHTPSLREYLPRRIRGELVTAVPDAVAEHIARRQNLDYVTFSPPWLSEFFAIYPGRVRRAPAPGTIEL